MLALYALALAVTLAVELSVAALMATGPRRALVLDALLLNLLTHPLACYAFWTDLAPFWAIEAIVWSVEALGYWWLGRVSARRALALAVVANALTTALSEPLGWLWARLA